MLYNFDSAIEYELQNIYFILERCLYNDDSPSVVYYI